MHIFDSGSYMVNWSPNLQTAVSDLVPNTCPSISHNGNSSWSIVPYTGGGRGNVEHGDIPQWQPRTNLLKPQVLVGCRKWNTVRSQANSIISSIMLRVVQGTPELFWNEWMYIPDLLIGLVRKVETLFLLQRRGNDGTTAFFNKTSDFFM